MRIQENKCSGKGHPLVAIHEGMVTNEMYQQNRSKVCKVSTAVKPMVEWRLHGGDQPTRIPDPGQPSIGLQYRRMKIYDFLGF